MTRPDETFATLPDPGRAGSLDELLEVLRRLKVWAGDPSYDTIKDRVNAKWRAAGRPAAEWARKSTVADCFRAGRRRLNNDLVVAVAQALNPDPGYVNQWRQALQVLGGAARAASQVRVLRTLPGGPASFVGRAAHLDQLRRAMHDDAAPVRCEISGPAGAGKTQLAVHAARNDWSGPVLFVDLRGFHPDPAQPPADPAAVLDGFLRLLGMTGQEIPHDLAGRVAAYRARVAGTGTLVVLDNAASAAQAGPLLTRAPGCPVLITSRRSLPGLRPTTRVTVDVFTPQESAAFLDDAARGMPAGPDPSAAARIAERCGHLPLALGLAAAHLRDAEGWTLTDHAERLDERHKQHRLDAGITLALRLSYQRLPDDRRRMFRLAALHPGPEVDDAAAAALTGRDLAAARITLRQLHRDNLIQQPVPGRYTFHDLVRAYAIEQAADEDPPPHRRAALTRLFDHYLAVAAAAMNAIAPAEAALRPPSPPAGALTPDLAEVASAHAWLDAERITLTAIIAHAAGQDWPGHAIRFSDTLFRYLNGDNPTGALAIHGYARHAAARMGDRAAEARALSHLGVAQIRMGRFGSAAEPLEEALRIFEELDDPAGQGKALDNLALIEERLGRYESAAELIRRSLRQLERVGQATSIARALVNLSLIEQRLGRLDDAAGFAAHAARLHATAGDEIGEANALSVLGEIETYRCRYDAAAANLARAMLICRRLGNRIGVAWTLDSIGTLHLHAGRLRAAAAQYRRALAAFRATGQRDGEAWALNGLGETARRDERPDDAVTHHAAALAIATETGDRAQQARAHAGLGHAHELRDAAADAEKHRRAAQILYTDLGMTEAARLALTAAH